MAKNITILGASYTDVPAVVLPQTGGGTATFFDPTGALTVSENGLYDVSAIKDLTVNVSGGGGGALKMGVIRPDAELLQTWTMDKMLVQDLDISIPAYTTTATTLKATENLATYDGTPLTYRYIVIQRCLTTPVYNISTLAKGREEYVFSVGAHEWVYQVSGQMRSLDGTKTYGQYSQMNAIGPISKEIYWSSGTAIGVYTANAYCLAQTLTAPTITSNKTITIKTPSIAIRGHTTYLTEQFFNAITDARLQYVIELWRVPITQGVFDGWMFTSMTDSVLNNINNNNGKLT